MCFALHALLASALAMMLSIPGSSASKSGTASSTTAAANAVVVAADARRAELRSAGQAAIHAFANALASLAQSGASSEIKGKAILAIKQVRWGWCYLLVAVPFLIAVLCGNWVVTSVFILINIAANKIIDPLLYYLELTHQAAKFYYGAASQHFKEFFQALVGSLRDIDLRVS